MTKQIQRSPIRDPGDISRESIETLRHIVVVVAEANKHLYTLQIDAAQAAFAENSRQLKSLLKSTGDTSAAIEQWSALFREKMQRFVEMSSAWVEITAQTMAEMSDLLAQSLSASAAISQKTGKRETEIPVERRVTASVIFFPERRAAATTKNVTSSIQQAARKKRNTG